MVSGGRYPANELGVGLPEALLRASSFLISSKVSHLEVRIVYLTSRLSCGQTSFYSHITPAWAECQESLASFFLTTMATARSLFLSPSLLPRDCRTSHQVSDFGGFALTSNPKNSPDCLRVYTRRTVPRYDTSEG